MEHKRRERTGVATLIDSDQLINISATIDTYGAEVVARQLSTLSRAPGYKLKRRSSPVQIVVKG